MLVCPQKRIKKALALENAFTHCGFESKTSGNSLCSDTRKFWMHLLIIIQLHWATAQPSKAVLSLF